MGASATNCKQTCGDLADHELQTQLPRSCSCDDELNGQRPKGNITTPRRFYSMDGLRGKLVLDGNEDVIHVSALAGETMARVPASPHLFSGDIPGAVPGWVSRSCRNDDKEAEKTALVNILKEFTQRAMAGVNVWTLDMETGEILSASYLLTGDTRKLYVYVSSKSDLCCLLKSIKTVTRGYETWPGLSQKFAEKLDNSLLKRLVVLEIRRDSHAPDETIYIIESSTENADWAVTSLHVLCSYHSHITESEGAEVVAADVSAPRIDVVVADLDVPVPEEDRASV